MSRLNFGYIQDFYKSREGRIGASDISKMISNPEHPSQSLAGYDNTALTLWEEKVGIKKPDPSGLPALVGDRIEATILEKFIYDFFGEKESDKFYYGYMLCEVERLKHKDLNCKPFNAGMPFKHHTESMLPFGVAHADCLYIPRKNAEGKIKHGNITIDISKPFGIQAKSSRLWATKRHGEFDGYDMNLSSWQGAPLKHYFQVQYEHGLYGHDISYLALMYNMSEYRAWEIKTNKEYRDKLLNMAEDMKRCIDKKQPPRHLAMNAKDVMKLYPEIKEDFREVSGQELKDAINIAKKYNIAKAQEKAWRQKKEDAQNSISPILKDTEIIKGMIDGEFFDIAGWKNFGGGDSMSLKELQEKHPRIYKSLKKEGLIKPKKTGRYPDIKLKEFDDG